MTIRLYECPHCSVIMSRNLDKCPACKKKIEYSVPLYIDAPREDTDD